MKWEKQDWSGIHCRSFDRHKGVSIQQTQQRNNPSLTLRKKVSSGCSYAVIAAAAWLAITRRSCSRTVYVRSYHGVPASNFSPPPFGYICMYVNSCNVENRKYITLKPSIYYYSWVTSINTVAQKNAPVQFTRSVAHLKLKLSSDASSGCTRGRRGEGLLERGLYENEHLWCTERGGQESTEVC